MFRKDPTLTSYLGKFLKGRISGMWILLLQMKAKKPSACSP